jgi:hypothetical protein
MVAAFTILRSVHVADNAMRYVGVSSGETRYTHSTVSTLWVCDTSHALVFSPLQLAWSAVFPAGHSIFDLRRGFFGSVVTSTKQVILAFPRTDLAAHDPGAVMMASTLPSTNVPVIVLVPGAPVAPVGPVGPTGPVAPTSPFWPGVPLVPAGVVVRCIVVRIVNHPFQSSRHQRWTHQADREGQ